MVIKSPAPRYQVCHGKKTNSSTVRPIDNGLINPLTAQVNLGLPLNFRKKAHYWQSCRQLGAATKSYHWAIDEVPLPSYLMICDGLSSITAFSSCFQWLLRWRKISNCLLFLKKGIFEKYFLRRLEVFPILCLSAHKLDSEESFPLYIEHVKILESVQIRLTTFSSKSIFSWIPCELVVVSCTSPICS